MISILMPILYDSENKIDAFESVIFQTFVKWELLIGIYAKMENFEKVWNFFSKFENSNSKIKLVRLEKRSRSEALTELYKTANPNCEWVAIKSVHDIWLNNKLAQQMNIAKYNQYKIIGTQIRYMIGRDYSRRLPSGDITNVDFNKKNGINGSTVIIHKSTNPKWDIYPDKDFWIKLQNSGVLLYNLVGTYVLTMNDLCPSIRK
jgi:hypothetical protein